MAVALLLVDEWRLLRSEQLVKCKRDRLGVSRWRKRVGSVRPYGLATGELLGLRTGGYEGDWRLPVCLVSVHAVFRFRW